VLDGTLDPPGEGEIGESNPQSKRAAANRCCHLANIIKEFGRLKTVAISPVTKLLWTHY